MGYERQAIPLLPRPWRGGEARPWESGAGWPSVRCGPNSDTRCTTSKAVMLPETSSRFQRCCGAQWSTAREFRPTVNEALLAPAQPFQSVTCNACQAWFQADSGTFAAQSVRLHRPTTAAKHAAVKCVHLPKTDPKFPRLLPCHAARLALSSAMRSSVSAIASRAVSVS